MWTISGAASRAFTAVYRTHSVSSMALVFFSALLLPSHSLQYADTSFGHRARFASSNFLFVSPFTPAPHIGSGEWTTTSRQALPLIAAHRSSQLQFRCRTRRLRAAEPLSQLWMSNKQHDIGAQASGALDAVQNQIFRMVKAANAFVMRLVDMLTGLSPASRMDDEDDRVLQEVEADLSKWLDKIRKIEDVRVTGMRQSLDTIYEALNIGGSLLPKNASATERLANFNSSADPVTAELIALISEMKGKYDDRIMDITDKVKPLTQEEIESGLEQVIAVRNITERLQTGAGKVTETVRPFTNEEVDQMLQWVDAGLQTQRRVGIQAAEEQLRAGVERARYAIWTRAKGRKVEPEAASVVLRDGGIWAVVEGKPAVPLLTDVGPSMYVDDTDGTSLFLGIRAAAARSQHRLTLGTLPVSAQRWLSCARQKLWWMSPDVGTRDMTIPAETQFLLLDLGNDLYSVVLPLVGNSFRTAIWGEPDAALSLSIESGDPGVVASVVTTSVYVAAGADPYQLLERAFAAVADRTGTFRVRAEKKLPPTLDVFGWCTWDAFYSQVNPEGVKRGLQQLAAGGTPSRLLILDDGWQSTDNDEEFRSVVDLDARSDVSAAELAGGGVIEAEDFASSQLTSLRDIPARVLTWWYTNVVERASYNSFPVRIWRWLTFNVIKNDLMKYFAEATDWSKRLTSVLPNSKFVQLGTLVRELKSEYGLQYTYCWHALTGYWLGVDPNSPGMERFGPVIQNPCIEPHFAYTPSILAVEPTMAWNPSSFIGMGMIPPQHIGEFFDEMHSTLHQAGIDGVKCDAQASITMLGAGYGGGPKITRTYVHAMEQSVKANLAGNCINCMCHPTENIYSFRDTAVARASDDFYPRENASHTVHVVNVVYNTLFLGEVVHPDWDMFQSEHPAASLHAAARAVGGCAVYTSDRPEIHNFDLLRRLVFPDGTVLRAKLPGRPTRDCLFADVCKDGTTALKVWNRNSVGGVVGVFNLQGAYWDRSIRNFITPDEPPPTVMAQVRPVDVEGLESDAGQYAVWSFEQQRMMLLGPDQTVDFELRPKQSDVLTVAPVQTLPGVAHSSGATATWAPVGLTQMLNGGGAVLDSYIDVSPNGLEQVLQGLKTALALAQNGTTGARQPSLLDIDFAGLLAMDDESVLIPAAELASSQLLASKQDSTHLKVIMAIKGQGDFLAYSSVAPETIQARPLSEAGAEDKPRDWPFTHDPSTGSLNFRVPDMQESDSGRWLLTLSWKRSDAPA